MSASSFRILQSDSLTIHQHQPAIFKGYCSPLVSSKNQHTPTTSSHYHNKDCHPSPLNSFNLSASRCPSAAQMPAAGPKKGISKQVSATSLQGQVMMRYRNRAKVSTQESSSKASRWLLNGPTHPLEIQ